MGELQHTDRLQEVEDDQPVSSLLGWETTRPSQVTTTMMRDLKGTNPAGDMPDVADERMSLDLMDEMAFEKIAGPQMPPVAEERATLNSAPAERASEDLISL